MAITHSSMASQSLVLRSKMSLIELSAPSLLPSSTNEVSSFHGSSAISYVSTHSESLAESFAGLLTKVHLSNSRKSPRAFKGVLDPSSLALDGDRHSSGRRSLRRKNKYSTTDESTPSRRRRHHGPRRRSISADNYVGKRAPRLDRESLSLHDDSLDCMHGKNVSNGSSACKPPPKRGRGRHGPRRRSVSADNYVKRASESSDRKPASFHAQDYASKAEANTQSTPVMSYVVSTKEYDGKSRPSIDSTVEVLAILDDLLQRRLSSNANVTNLEWVETTTPFRQGLYTGAVDAKGRPHGRGTWVSGDENLYGWWYKGVFLPNEYIHRRVSEISTEVNSGADLPRRSATTSMHDAQRQDSESDRGYTLGDTLRSQSHMVIEPTRERTIQAVDSLQTSDFAWIKRSDKTYSYAMVLEKRDDSIVFLVEASGSTKSFPRHLWSKSFIRSVATRDRAEERKDSEAGDEVGNHKLPNCAKELQSRYTRRLERFNSSLLSSSSSHDLSSEHSSLYNC